MARIELIENKARIGEDQYGEFDLITEILGSVRGPFSVLMHSPGLAGKVCQSGAQVRLGSQLTMAERELALLSTARENDAPYEWSAHAPNARRNGVPESAIEAIRLCGDTSGLQPNERDIIEFVRELLRTNRVSQERFDALLSRHGARWLVELTATIGQYQYIAAINNVFEVNPSGGCEELPIPAPGR